MHSWLLRYSIRKQNIEAENEAPTGGGYGLFQQSEATVQVAFFFGAESIRKSYVVPPAACLSSFRQANRSGCSGVLRCILPNMRWLGCRVSHFRSWHMILVRWPERPFVQRPVRQPCPTFGHIRRSVRRDKQISICWLVLGCLRLRIRLSYFNGADRVHSIDQYP